MRMMASDLKARVIARMKIRALIEAQVVYAHVSFVANTPRHRWLDRCPPFLARPCHSRCTGGCGMSRTGSETTISAAAGGAEAPRRRTCVNRLRLEALGGILRGIYSGRESRRGMPDALQGGASRVPPPEGFVWEHVCCRTGGNLGHLQQFSQVREQ